MSYILDALKKSEQQRQHAQLSDVATAVSESGGQSESEDVPECSMQTDAAVQESTTKQGAAAMTVAVVVFIAVLITVFVAVQDEQPPLVAKENLPVHEALSVPEFEENSASDAAPVVNNSQKVSVIDIAAADAELSRGVPAMEITSHIYSSVAAKRSIVVNGQRLTEGDGVFPGILIEEITTSGMVINYRNRLLRIDRSRGWQ